MFPPKDLIIIDLRNLHSVTLTMVHNRCDTTEFANVMMPFDPWFPVVGSPVDSVVVEVVGLTRVIQASILGCTVLKFRSGGLNLYNPDSDLIDSLVGATMFS